MNYLKKTIPDETCCLIPKKGSLKREKAGLRHRFNSGREAGFRLIKKWVYYSATKARISFPLDAADAVCSALAAASFLSW